MKKLFICICILSLIGKELLFAESAEKIIQVKIDNKTKSEITKFPIIITSANLNFSQEQNFNSARVQRSDGKSYLCQIDDIDGDGTFNEKDEIAALVDLAPGDNNYELFLSELKTENGEKKNAPDRKVELLSISNEKVKTVVSSLRGSKCNIYLKDNDAWINLTGTGEYYIDLSFDGKWEGWKEISYKAEIINSGPIRKIIRKVSERHNEETDKKIRMTQDWNLFADRNEILTKLEFTNITENMAVQFSSITKGFYNLTPGGKKNSEENLFAGISKDGKLLKGILGITGYEQGFQSKNKFMWYDTYYHGSQEKQAGLGTVAESLPFEGGVLLKYVKRKSEGGALTLRMTETCYPKIILWPGKSYVFTQWYVAHPGDYQQIQSFCELLNNIEIKFK